MLYGLTTAGLLAAFDLGAIWGTVWPIVLLALGFSLVIFVHELGHFLAAKWAKVKVEQFAVGFGHALVSYRQGLGIRWGSSADEMQRRITDYLRQRGIIPPGDAPDELSRDPTDEERDGAMQSLGLSETEYRINWMPLGGYVKMMGQEDFVVNKSGELKVRDDPASFTNKSISQRMVIVSAGVIMNLIFAAIAFTVVMMMGLNVQPAVVGAVMPDSPASRAGLQSGDRIEAINGADIHSFNDMMQAVILSDPGEELVLDVDRDGKLVEPKPRILPEYKKDESVRQIGISNGMNRRVLVPGLRIPDEPSPNELQSKDELCKLVLESGEQKEFKDLGVFVRAMVAARGRPIKVVVRRPVHPDKMTDADLFEDRPVDSFETMVDMQALWIPLPYVASDYSTTSMLGLVPRLTVIGASKSFIKAGVERGDIIRKFGDYLNPTQDQLHRLIAEGKGQSISIEVCRPVNKNKDLSGRAVRLCVENREIFRAAAEKDLDVGKRMVLDAADRAGLSKTERDGLAATLDKQPDAVAMRRWLDDVDVHVLSPIVPTSKFSLLSKSKPTLDVQAFPVDDEQIVVAEVLDKVGERESPARRAGIPVGAVIVAAGGKPVHSWHELTEVLREKAGHDVSVTYRQGGPVHETTLSVPMCISAALRLSEGTRIASIDGKKSAQVTGSDGKSREIALPDWQAVREILRASVNSTVAVEYVSAEGVPGRGEFAVTPDNTDPWLMRVNYWAIPVLSCVPLQTRMAESNPVRAAMVGFKRAYQSTVQTIQSLRHVVIAGDVGTEKISGPVGILRIGSSVAEKGIVDLLWFLGIISANLAVINFLPMPIVDGGLFLFLVLEKLRGEPVSIKTQIVTQLVGIALIATLFILVTYQDIVNWIYG